MYRLQSRGGMGVTNIKLTEKNGRVAGISHVTGDEQILLITEQGMIIRTNVSDLRSMGRSTQGVRVINVDENDRVVGLVKLNEKDEGDPADQPEEGGSETAPPEEPVH
jgi:DNA gyrase subunit A